MKAVPVHFRPQQAGVRGLASTLPPAVSILTTKLCAIRVLSVFENFSICQSVSFLLLFLASAFISGWVFFFVVVNEPSERHLWSITHVRGSALYAN